MFKKIAWPSYISCYQVSESIKTFNTISNQIKP